MIPWIYLSYISQLISMMIPMISTRTRVNYEQKLLKNKKTNVKNDYYLDFYIKLGLSISLY